VKSRRLPRRLLSVLIYAVGVLIFAEAFSRAVLAWPPVFRRIARRDEVAWRLEWVRRHAAGLPASLPFDVYHPTRGWAVRSGLRDLPVFLGKTLSTNSDGMRGSRDYAEAKPAEVRRLVLLGDSFTFGEGVSDSETYAHQLSLFLPRLEVLNLGVHGYGNDQMLLALREGGLRYHPDLVVLGFVHEDLDRNILGFRDFAKPRFLLSRGRLLLTNTPVPTPAEVLAQETWRSRLADLFSVIGRVCWWSSRVARRDAEGITRAILKEIADDARRAGAVPVFFYLPVHTEILDREERPTPGEAFLLPFCESVEIRCLSLRPYLARHLDPGGFPVKAPHWAPQVHRAAAEAIRDYLEGSGLLLRLPIGLGTASGDAAKKRRFPEMSGELSGGPSLVSDPSVRGREAFGSPVFADGFFGLGQGHQGMFVPESIYSMARPIL
jgi:hypothetical protein